jgi:hypothetical protein
MPGEVHVDALADLVNDPEQEAASPSDLLVALVRVPAIAHDCRRATAASANSEAKRWTYRYTVT